MLIMWITFVMVAFIAGVGVAAIILMFDEENEASLTDNR